jgi:hypothetical protein
MKYDWILDVLADLKTFAQSNGLDALAEQLDDTRLIAATEIVSLAERASPEVRGDDAATGRHFGESGPRARA